MVRRIFRFDEASLNSSSSSSNIASPSSSSSFGTSSTGILNPTNQSTTTIGDFSLRSSSTQVDGSVSSILNNHGIFEGLDPTTSTTFENIADHLRGEIFESVQKVFKNHCSDENKLLAITENLHNDDDNTGFLGEILEHLKDKQGEHYDFALKQFNEIVGGSALPNAWQSLVELIYDFVLNPVNEQIGGLSGNVKQKFSPRISVTFTFSLFCNPQGMIPYSFTVTSHFLITLGLSFSIFIGITIVGFQKNGLHFLSFLLPAGVPLPLAPFLVLLELIPYCFRALSSGIRLFANMMAGHSSVKILSGFAWTMLCMNDLFYFIGDLGPLFIVLALTGLELGVAI
uniref:F-ATPase protein 6 n=1 Tax=Solanum lycopersicum TaxID=4081 RepID=A0A494GA38_SOLLC